jgi:hypothetical protein
MKRPGSLFHTIVVVGASIGAGTGCGSDERVPDAHTGQPDARVADARVVDGAPADAQPDGGIPDAMVVIL